MSQPRGVPRRGRASLGWFPTNTRFAARHIAAASWGRPVGRIGVAASNGYPASRRDGPSVLRFKRVGANALPQLSSSAGDLDIKKAVHTPKNRARSRDLQVPASCQNARYRTTYGCDAHQCPAPLVRDAPHPPLRRRMVAVVRGDKRARFAPAGDPPLDGLHRRPSFRALNSHGSQPRDSHSMWAVPAL